MSETEEKRTSVAAKIAALEKAAANAARAKANAAKPVPKPVPKPVSNINNKTTAANATRKKNAVNAKRNNNAANVAVNAKRNNNAANAANVAVNAKRNNNAANAAATMNVHVQNFGGRIETFNVKQDATVGELRRLANQLVEAPIERVKLTVRSNSGFELLDDDTRTLESYGVIDDSTVYVVVRAVDPGTLLHKYTGEFTDIRMICESNNELFIVDGISKNIYVLQTQTGEVLRTIDIKQYYHFISDICCIDNELFLKDKAEGVIVIDAKNGTYKRAFNTNSIPSHHGLTYRSICALDGELFIPFSEDGIVDVLSKDGTQLRTITSDKLKMHPIICVSTSGELYLSNGGTIEVFNISSGLHQRTIQPVQKCRYMCVDGNVLFVSSDKRVDAYYALDGTPIGTISDTIHPTNVYAFDGKLFVCDKTDASLKNNNSIKVFQAGFDIPLSRRDIAKRAMLEATFNKVNFNTIQSAQSAPSMVVPRGTQHKKASNPRLTFSNILAKANVRPLRPRYYNEHIQPLPRESVKSIFENTLLGQLSQINNKIQKDVKAHVNRANNTRKREKEKQEEDKASRMIRYHITLDDYSRKNVVDNIKLWLRTIPNTNDIRVKDVEDASVQSAILAIKNGCSRMLEYAQELSRKPFALCPNIGIVTEFIKSIRSKIMEKYNMSTLLKELDIWNNMYYSLKTCNEVDNYPLYEEIEYNPNAVFTQIQEGGRRTQKKRRTSRK